MAVTRTDRDQPTNVYHLTYSPGYGIACLYFWGCNLRCRACLLKKEIYDCHLAETRERIFDPNVKAEGEPKEFLNLEQLKTLLLGLEVEQVILMGAEPSIDPALPSIVEWLHVELGTRNTLLTNGLRLPPVEHIDTVVFSIKAHSESLHTFYAGKSNRRILENFVSLYRLKKKLYVESVLIPGLVDVDEIERIARLVADIDRTLPYRIDAYLPVGNNPWPRPSEEHVKEAVKLAQKYLENVTCITGSEDLAYDVIRVF